MNSDDPVFHAAQPCRSVPTLAKAISDPQTRSVLRQMADEAETDLRRYDETMDEDNARR